MGYTHYWTIEKKLNKKQFLLFSEDCKMVAEQAKKDGIRLSSWDGSGAPEFSKHTVSFNGFAGDDEAHESFCIGNDEDTGFNFCKTAYKPYDVVVTACLILLDFHYGTHVSISSDGEAQDWQAGLDLVKQVFSNSRAEIPPRVYSEDGNL